MSKTINKIIVVFYWLFIFSPLPYILGSAISYYSVKHEFGMVPDSETLFSLLRTGNRKVFILPFEWGEVFLGIFFYSILAFPFFILLNHIIRRKLAGGRFQPKLAIALVAIYFISFILIFRTDPFGGWYLVLMME